jgi:hypothetical protein
MLGIVQMWKLKQFFVASLLFPGMAMCTVFTEKPAILPVVRKNSLSINLPVSDWTIIVKLLSRGMTVTSSLFVINLIKIFKS